MNIFVLSEDPVKAAQMQCDKHVVKMVIEEGQILATTHRVLDGQIFLRKGKKKMVTEYCLDWLDGSLPKATHVNHPCVKWARESSENYNWLYQHFVALLLEFEFRYGHEHSYEKYVDFLKNLPENISRKELTPFAQAMPEEYKNKNVVVAYRNYYLGEKLRFAKWNHKRETPNWVKGYLMAKIIAESGVSIKESGDIFYNPISKIYN